MSDLIKKARINYRPFLNSTILLIDDSLPPIEKRNTKTRRLIIIAKNVLVSELEK